MTWQSKILLFCVCMVAAIYFVIVLMPHIVTGTIAAIMGTTMFLGLLFTIERVMGAWRWVKS